MSGHVYLMGNRSMPTYYKIGMCSGSPMARAHQLSSGSGVPEAFDVICHFGSIDPREDERVLHDFLADYRNSFAREFFRFGWAQMPWAVGLFKHHPEATSFYLCDGWRRHKYVPDLPIENPWATVDEDGHPEMSGFAPDLVYVQEGSY